MFFIGGANMLSLHEWKWFIESMDLRLKRLNYNTFILEDLAHPNFSFHNECDQQIHMIMMHSLRNLIEYSVHFTVTKKLKSKDSRAVRKMIQRYNDHIFIYKRDLVSEFLRILSYLSYEAFVMDDILTHNCSLDDIDLVKINTRSTKLRRVIETLINMPSYSDEVFKVLDTKPKHTPLIIKLELDA